MNIVQRIFIFIWWKKLATNMSKDLIWQLLIAIPAVIATPLFISTSIKIQAIGFFIFALSNCFSVIYMIKTEKRVLSFLFLYYLVINLFGAFHRL